MHYMHCTLSVSCILLCTLWCINLADCCYIDWFRAVQGFITAGLVGLLVSVIVIFIYMCVPSASKKRTLIILSIVSFVSGKFAILGWSSDQLALLVFKHETYRLIIKIS